jgi:hypothetical protein
LRRGWKVAAGLGLLVGADTDVDVDVLRCLAAGGSAREMVEPR